MVQHQEAPNTGGRAARVSAADVARSARVSPATVSYVMNGRPGVSDDTRARILQIADQLGYRPSERSTLLRQQRTRVIGLVVADIANPFYSAVAAGAIDEARAQGYEVFLAHTEESAESLDAIIETMVARHVDGVVLTVLHPDDGAVVRRMRRAHLPFIQVSRRIPQLDADFVGIDDLAAATTLMNHLLDHGYDDLAIIAGPNNSTASAARAQGFVSAAHDRGFKIAPDRVVESYLSEDAGRRATEQMLASGPPPRAIVCGNDAIAAGAVGALLQAGLRIPHDVAVTGFDGLYADASPLAMLTTIIQPRRPMAAIAVEQLIRRIEGRGGPHQSFVQPHALRIGPSCGCPPGEASA